MIGRTISHYEILDKLGQGGMGDVYRARDITLDRDVALKFLPPELTRDSAAKTRFVREAQAASALDHPNICTIYEVDETDDGQLFIAMAHYEGEVLTETISRGPLPLADVADIATQIAMGLATAHQKNIVHRDLKTANVFVTSTGLVKILDFGLAKLSGVSQLTRPQTTLGTVTYMSPEQARGGDVDRRSDVWSLGVVLYEMVTGQLPFKGEFSEALVYSLINEAPTPVTGLRSGVPMELERIIDKCLAKDPDERYQHLDDFIVDLKRAKPSLALEPGMKPAGRLEAERPARRSLPLWVAALGWIAAAIFLGAVVFRTPPSHNPVRVRPITYSGHDWAPSASPAGDVIAFVSDRDGISRIWLKEVARGGEMPITDGPDELPRFSPDGSQILFVRHRGPTRDLYRTSVVGGQPRRIMEDVLEADWSPDGTQVAFIRINPVGETNVVFVGVADVQTGDERILAEIQNRLGYGVRWSPDGRTIAVSEASLTTAAADASYIDLIDPATGELERLTITDWAGPYASVHWAPTGRAFVTGQAPVVLTQVGHFPCQIMEYDLDSRDTRPLFWSPLKLPHGGWVSSTIAVVGTDQIVIDEHVVQASLSEVSLVGPRENQTLRTLTRGLGRDRQPAYSPDGTRVIFASNRSGNIDLWTVDPNTKEVRQLTDDFAIDWDPAFTPEGERVLWTSNRGGNMEIWIAAVDGSRARQVTNDGVDAENPTMTADGNWIVYGSTNDAKMGVWKIRPDGSDATKLAAGSYLLAEVSPDGRYTLFSRTSGMGYMIHVAEIESGEMVPFEIDLPRSAAGQNVVVGRARWMPDGRGIAYVGQDNEGRSGVYAQDFVPGQDTSGSRRPLAGFSDRFATESFGISPDGTTIVISTMTERRTLQLVEFVPLRWRE